MTNFDVECILLVWCMMHVHASGGRKVQDDLQLAESRKVDELVTAAARARQSPTHTRNHAANRESRRQTRAAFPTPTRAGAAHNKSARGHLGYSSFKQTKRISRNYSKLTPIVTALQIYIVTKMKVKMYTH